MSPSSSLLDITPVDVESLRPLSDGARGSLFAVLDACDEPRIPMKAYDLREKAACLYRGKSEWTQAAIAPYLVTVQEDELAWITDNLRGTFWGYFLYASSRVSLTTLRTHLRRFLTVKGPQGEELYFRFYDPRVIVEFLETATEEELTQFFGPIDTLFLERREGFLSLKPSSLVRL